jgi:hypothetical protein
MKNNPYQDVIDWLNSTEGKSWSYFQPRIWQSVLYNFRSAHCGTCDREPDDTGPSFPHPADKRFYEGNADLTTDGPYIRFANQWVEEGFDIVVRRITEFVEA